MSDMECVYGTIIEVSTEVNGFNNKCRIEKISPELVDEEDQYIESLTYTYDRENDKLFKLQRCVDLDFYGDTSSKKNQDGSIDFVAIYYNGAESLNDVVLEIARSEN